MWSQYKKSCISLLDSYSRLPLLSLQLPCTPCFPSSINSDHGREYQTSRILINFENNHVEKIKNSDS
uniref:Uncharacterized protein n=1 Tax=Arundo donax TaxID=35708 RepID=A0A0A8ZGV5_ARUDO